MKSQILLALRATAVTLVLTGIIYPLTLTGAAQLLFPSSARGSLLRDAKGQIVGSTLIGQAFSKPWYFQGRPSAAGEHGYDALASGGSNLGPTSAKLHERVKADAERLLHDNPESPGPVPAELVTASGSGLDPHISPRAALWQLPRVARARNLAPERIRPIILDLTEGRDLGFLGEPRVNVLLLNQALDRQFGPVVPR